MGRYFRTAKRLLDELRYHTQPQGVSLIQELAALYQQVDAVRYDGAVPDDALAVILQRVKAQREVGNE